MDNVEAHTMRVLGTVPAHTMRSSAARFSAGDVLYGRLRPYLNKVVHVDFNGLCSSEFIVLEQSDWLDSRLLAYRLNASDFVAFASHLNEGDRPRVHWDQIGAFDLLLPPLTEQRRIVERIEELFSKLDAGVAALRRARANLKRYRAAVLRAAVEGRLTEEWRAQHPGVEPASVLLERILQERRRKWEEEQLSKYAENEQKPAVSWRRRHLESEPADTGNLPKLPQTWVWVRLDQIAQTASGGTPDRSRADYFGPGIPWVKSGELGDSLVHETSEQITGLGLRNSSAKIFPKGTLCIALYGATVGRLGILGIDAATNQAVCGIFLPPQVHTGFAYHFLESIRASLVGSGRGGAQPNISQEIVRRTLLPLPPRQEQEQIVAEVERRLSVVDEIEKQVDAGLRRAARLRQSILRRAFEGKLVPQDPSDEPASTLLERIAATRATTERQSGTPGTRRGRRRMRAYRGMQDARAD